MGPDYIGSFEVEGINSIESGLPAFIPLARDFVNSKTISKKNFFNFFFIFFFKDQNMELMNLFLAGDYEFSLNIRYGLRDKVFFAFHAQNLFIATKTGTGSTFNLTSPSSYIGNNSQENSNNNNISLTSSGNLNNSNTNNLALLRAGVNRSLMPQRPMEISSENSGKNSIVWVRAGLKDILPQMGGISAIIYFMASLKVKFFFFFFGPK